MWKLNCLIVLLFAVAATVLGACAALSQPLSGTQQALIESGQPIVIQPATATQPAIIVAAPPKLVAATQKAGTILNQVAPILTAPDVGTAVAEGIKVGLQYAPPQYGAPIALGLFGLLLAGKLLDAWKVKQANQTAQTAIKTPGTTTGTP